MSAPEYVILGMLIFIVLAIAYLIVPVMWRAGRWLGMRILRDIEKAMK